MTRRQFAVPQLDGLDGAADAVRPMLQDPTARPYARFWLGSHDLPVPAEHCHPDDVLLLFVDTAGLLAELGAAAEVVAQLSGLGSPGEQVELVRRLWRVESPSTRPVLTMLARDAPPAVSKAARKALHSLGSAGR